MRIDERGAGNGSHPPEWLDRAIDHLFASGLKLTGVVNRHGVDDRAADELLDVVDELGEVVRELRSGSGGTAMPDRDAAPDGGSSSESVSRIDERKRGY